MDKDPQRHITRGHWMGFIVALAAIGSAVYCATIGQTVVAVVLVGTFLGGVVTSFLRR